MPLPRSLTYSLEKILFKFIALYLLFVRSFVLTLTDSHIIPSFIHSVIHSFVYSFVRIHSETRNQSISEISTTNKELLEKYIH